MIQVINNLKRPLHVMKNSTIEPMGDTPHPQSQSPMQVKEPKFSVLREEQIEKKVSYHVYISEGIGKPSEYIGLINLLKMVEDSDEVHIHLNSPGGYLDTTVQILNAMANCKANIITYAEGEVASAATFIFLAGDVQIVNRDVSFMCHTYSAGAFGKSQEMGASVSNMKKRFTKFMNRHYEGFLTPIEIRDMLNGKDIYFEDEELVKRLHKRLKFLEGKAKAAAKAAKSETTKKDAKPVKKTYRKFTKIEDPSAIDDEDEDEDYDDEDIDDEIDEEDED